MGRRRGINTKQSKYKLKKKNQNQTKQQKKTPNPPLKIHTRQLTAANKSAEYFLKRENKFVLKLK